MQGDKRQCAIRLWDLSRTKKQRAASWEKGPSVPRTEYAMQANIAATNSWRGFANFSCNSDAVMNQRTTI